MMYMSGRALHPISVSLAHRLQEEFSGELLLSFSAGADAFNIAHLISCGFTTITVCSDLLKPGGYMRLHQYFSELNRSLEKHSAANIGDYINKSAGRTEMKAAALSSLESYSVAVLSRHISVST